MAAPLIVRLVMDAAGYLKTVDTAVASNTKLEQSSLGVGKAMSLSADQQVSASLKATRAVETQIAAQRALAADSTKSAEVRARASLLADRAQGRLNSSLGLTTAAAAGTSRAVQAGERDLGKFTRGALAGSGAAASLGRSLAFASTGFIAIAGSATLIKASISAALTLAKTQRQVEAQLKTSGKSWDQYGGSIDQADLKLSHISGFTNQELLQGFGYLVRVNGNVAESLKLTAEAADVARGRNISLASAAIALAKAQGGSVTALRRLGIIVPKGVEGMKALAFVQEKFAGQAAAGATVADKFRASLVNTEEIIGAALLPTFTRLTTEITDWLAKMTESGRLQHDLNDAVTVGSAVFHTAGAIIGVVDKITGSFANTLKILIGVWLGRELVKGITYVDKLVGSWTAVEAAANGAAAAEGRAVAGGELAGGAGVAGTVGATGGNVGFLAQRAASKRAVASAAEAEAAQAEAARSEALISRVSKYTSTMVPAEQSVAAVGTAAAVSTGEVGLLSASLLGLGAITLAPIVIPIAIHWEDKFHLPGILGTRSLDPRTWLNTLAGGAGNFFAFIHKQIQGEGTKRALEEINASAAKQQQKADVAAAKAAFGSSFFRFGQHNFVPTFQGEPGQRSVPLIPKSLQFLPGGKTAAAAGPFGAATPIAVYTKYVQTITEQIAVAQAALTKSTKDDVAAAKAIIARIKRGIARGHYEGASLVQALQDEATQQGVLNNARQAAAQQAAKIAAAKKAAASSYTTPIDLQLAEARAALTKSTADDIRAEKGILAAAQAALAAGNKNKKGQLAALQIALQAKQALQSLAATTASTFTQPLRLQLALAKAQALGTNQEGILLKMKAALEKALKSAKGNIQKQIDIYNQIAAINQQLGSSAGLGFGNYKQASLAAETAGLGLTQAQRKALEARLSQRGPGGTVPGSGVGAGGFIIGPDGRPIQVHRHRHPHHGHSATGSGGAGARTDRLLRALERSVKRPLRVVVDLDGVVIADNVTRHQERHRRRNSSQRRGPNAGVGA